MQAALRPHSAYATEGETMTEQAPTNDQNKDQIPGLEDLQAAWGWLLALGILWIILGTLAIIMPFAATLAVEMVFGVLFLIGGVAQLIQAFKAKGWGGAAFQVVSGLLALALGVILLLFPLQGVFTLTILLAAFFVAQGIVKIISAFRERPSSGWGWLLFSGLLGLVVGIIIWAGLPGTAIWVLGLLVGIELIFSGWAMVMIAMARKKA